MILQEEEMYPLYRDFNTRAVEYQRLPIGKDRHTQGIQNTTDAIIVP